MGQVRLGLAAWIFMLGDVFIRRGSMFIDTLRTVQARPIELISIDEIVCGYIHLIQVLRAPEECDHIITTLTSLRERYDHLLLEMQDQTAPDIAEEDQPMLFQFQASGHELVIFSAAVVGYMNFWRHDAEMYQQSLIKNVLKFQKRYLIFNPSQGRIFNPSQGRV
jgi:hypothetical protein